MGQGKSKNDSTSPEVTNQPGEVTNVDDNKDANDLEHIQSSSVDAPSSDIQLPQQETSPPDPLKNDPDFMLVFQFVQDSKDDEHGVAQRIDQEKLIRLLTAVARVFSKFPTNQDAVLLAMQSVPYFKDAFPENAPAILTEVQMNAFEAFSQLEIEGNSSLLKTAMNFIVILWVFYPTTLPAACNIKQLARLVNCALTPEPNGQSRKEEAIECGNACVTYLMRVLSDSQVNALESEGVCDKLGALLVYFDEMPEQTLQQIIIGVGIFAEVKGGSLSCLDESLFTSLLFAAQKYTSNSALQDLIWRLMSLFCQRSCEVAKVLFQLNIVDALVSILKKTDTSFLPFLRFLMIACHLSGNQYIPVCLGNSDLIELLTGVIKREPSTPKFNLEVLASTCDFVSLLCSKCEELQAFSKLMELDLVTQLENAARHSPQACLLPACIAIEGIVNVLFPDVPAKKDEVSASDRKVFHDQNHHLFVKDMLSNPLVYENPAFIELMYVTFQKILKATGVERLEEICSKEFLEFFVVSFIRDTVSLSSQANRIVFTAHYFVFQMKKKEIIEVLRELDFHTAVVGLVSMSESYELMSTAMGLLACLIGKYYEYLKDVKPFLKAQVPDTLLKKVKMYGMSRRSHFGEDFSRILLNLTADKDLSLELYNQGFLDQLVEQVSENYIDLVKRAMIHAIGNIALCGQNVKQVLLDRKVYEILLKTLSSNLKKGDPFLLSACCRVLHILASGDWAKRKFVESGCIEVLLDMLKTRHDNPEVCWRPLGLLSSLGFMAVLNRRFVLTCDVVETVVKILTESTNGKVTSYTTLVFLGSGELDEGSVKLRELGVSEHLHKAMKNAEFLKQAPDLERWSIHVLEKLDLHTIVLPAQIVSSFPPPTLHHISDWPPFMDTTAMEVDSTTSSQMNTRKLLPLEDDYMCSHTPVAIELSDAAKNQLSKLGLNPGEPLFRIGRVYGSTFGLCSNCEKEGTSEELVIRPQSMTPHQYQHLIDNGWYRRGGVKMFRLRYNHNVHCCDWETRVSVHDFDHRTHKSYKKVLKRMPEERLKIVTKPTHFCREAFDLYNDYHIQRHEKPWKSEYSYCEHIVNSPAEIHTIDDLSYGTHHQLYYLDNKLVAIGVIDIVPKGIVSIYMWYNVSKEVSKLSFGVYSALKEIDFVREMSKRNPNMKYYYLQGWNNGNKKLSYKAHYEPEDFYCPCIVEDWVSGLESVTTAKEEAIVRLKPEVKEGEASTDVKDKSQSTDSNSTSNDQSNKGSADKEESEDKKKEENKDDSSDSKKVQEGSDEQETKDKASESTDGGGEEVKQEGAAKKTEQNSDSKPDESKNEDKKPSEPVVSCEAFPNDLERYKRVTGQSTVDVGKIVVCLNYTQYMYLGELFEQFDISTEQRSIMEKRFREIVVAIGPELTSQLVIDLKACPPKAENMQVERSANSVVKNN